MTFYVEIKNHFDDAPDRWSASGFVYGLNTKFLEYTTYSERQHLPEVYRSYEIEKNLKEFEAKEDENLLEILLKHPFFDGNEYSAKPLVIGSSTMKLSAYEIMQCLKRDVKKHDLPKAVNTLKSILEVKNYSLKIVAVVAGVSVLRKTKIAENLHIEPINNLPKGGLLKHFIDELANDTKNRMNPMSYSPLQGDRIKFLTTQRCALVYDYGVVEAYQDDEEKLKDIQHKQLKISSSLYEIAYAISAAHSCAPFVELKCMIADHEGLNNLFSTGGGSIEIAKLIPTDLPKSEPIDNDYVANFIDAYLSIQDDTLHQKVKIALQYYVESQWVYDIRDKIIGHAIALECLLLDRNTKQKTKNLSKRASSILASSKKEKAYYFTLFQIFYGLRSDIVHAGHLKDKKYKMTDGEELFSQQIYNKVKELIPVIIKHLVQKST